jgi:Na+/H+ antiporter NhaD/arsenite permease-like protein
MSINILQSTKAQRFLMFLVVFLFIPAFSFASGGNMPAIGNIRLEFILFGLTLLGVAFFHKHTFWVAISGLTIILLYKFIFDPHFHFMEHLIGETSFIEQVLDKEARQGEWGIILNLTGLLLGFAVLAKVFEESGVPDIIPNYLPNDWKGPFVLLIMVFFMSAFLDNIAAALIGGTIAMVVFKNKVHIGYIAAIVAVSNAGGAGSVVGDTTTTMMWIDGVSMLDVLHAFVGAFVVLGIVAWYGSHQQDKMQRIQADASIGVKIDGIKLAIVGLMLVGAISTNVLFDLPAFGVWIAILIGALIRKMPWHEIPGSVKGTIFLLSLVISASLMPVDELPEASWMSAFILGFVSAVFDNIPLTKLCLDQGHYDWGLLAYAVGFGGSMVWFGSSAGVAITNKFPHARNVGLWIRKGWHVFPAYVAGFFVLFLVWGWHPTDNKKHKVENCPVEGCPHNPNTTDNEADTLSTTYRY